MTSPRMIRPLRGPVPKARPAARCQTVHRDSKRREGMVLLTCKDDLRDTARPCLDAAGADVARTVHLTSVGDGPPTLVHLAAIAEAAL